MILRIDMTTQCTYAEEIPYDYTGLGGRGLTSIIINNEVPADCNPLDPDNRLIFSPGFLTGTPLVNTGRLSIGAKSPLTCGIKKSNVGGTMANALAHHGITAIIVVSGGGSSTASLISASRSSQIHTAALDSTGLCMFAQSGGLNNVFQAITAITGKEFGDREWQELGVRCLTAEVQFNHRAGLTQEDDRLPAMFYKENLSPYHGTVPYSGEELDTTLEAFQQHKNGDQ